jgi:hypothetical protein
MEMHGNSAPPSGVPSFEGGLPPPLSLEYRIMTEPNRSPHRAPSSTAALLGILTVGGILLGGGGGTPLSSFGGPGDALGSPAASTAPVHGQDPALEGLQGQDPESRTLPDHGVFTRVLERVVQIPRVDYALLKEERAGLDRYVDALSATDPGALEAASREEQLAFWINAYNACMLRLVVDHYPIEAGGVGLFGAVRNRVAGYPDNSVWQIRDVFSRNHCPVAGRDRSQDEIEHEIIRPRFEEPRIHFAVNCAALSCPVLWPDAYTADALEDQLDRAVRHLIRNPDHFLLEGTSPATLTLNKVLDWYAEDFNGTEGLKTFFADYLQGSARERVLAPTTQVRFFEYDWTLNDVRR